jgi:hypothetical protein
MILRISIRKISLDPEGAVSQLLVGAPLGTASI